MVIATNVDNMIFGGNNGARTGVQIPFVNAGRMNSASPPPSPRSQNLLDSDESTGFEEEKEVEEEE